MLRERSLCINLAKLGVLHLGAFLFIFRALGRVSRSPATLCFAWWLPLILGNLSQSQHLRAKRSAPVRSPAGTHGHRSPVHPAAADSGRLRRGPLALFYHAAHSSERSDFQQRGGSGCLRADVSSAQAAVCKRHRLGCPTHRRVFTVLEAGGLT